MLNIKFRGKRKDSGAWVYGYYFISPLTQENCSDVKPKDGWFFLSDGKLRHCISDDGCVFEVIPETVGQWTGHQDYHCVDIYKDDVVEWDSEDGYINTGLVIWEEEHEDTSEIAGFHYKIIASREAPEDSDDCVYKVIDNIHDNPSLLK